MTHARHFCTLALLCLPLTVACADDGEADSSCINGNLDIDCGARLEVSESTTGTPRPHGDLMAVGGAAAGETLELRLVLRNTAAVATAAPLRVAAIKMTQALLPGETAGPFGCFNHDGSAACADFDGQWPAVVPAGAALPGAVNQQEVLIRYTRKGNVERSARLYIKVSGDPQLNDGIYLLRLTAGNGTARIKLVPDVLAFGPLSAGDSQLMKLEMVNSGDAELLIHQLDLKAPAAFSLRLQSADGQLVVHEGSASGPLQLTPPLAIAAGEQHAVEVTFKAPDDKAQKGTLLVGSNDTTPGAAVAQLVANANVPCIKVTPTGGLDFGSVKIGGQLVRDVELRNCGGSALVIHRIDLGEGTSGQEFDLLFGLTHDEWPAVDPTTGPTATAPLTLANNAIARFQVRYQPDQVSAFDSATGLPNPDVAEVRVFSNALHKVDTIPCRGLGVLEVCPTAKIKILEGEEVVPQTNLHLIGDLSVAAAGAKISKYKWSLAKQPAGTQIVFVPSSSFPNPQVAVNAAGEYRFELQVWDDNDKQACAPAQATVLVMPDEAIHIELLWDTPADPDQADSGPAAGADMDLHFAHHLASGPDVDCDGQPDPWFSNPFDTFWFNTGPNWGSSLSAKDDPGLDLDDTDGGGPENLNLDEPEGTLSKPVAYSVGVHYWNDHGFGASFATVNVYIVGVLAAQLADVKMQPLDMWYVGKLNWPNVMSGGVLTPFATCRQVPDSDLCAKKGKWWQPTGDACVTPCYQSPAFAGAGTGAGACVK